MTIGIVFCERDKDCVQSIINEINSFVKVDHEILLWNNCTYDINFIGIKAIYTEHKNLYAYNARKKLLTYMSGKYIWFIDPDDSLNNINIFYSGNADILIFNTQIYKYYQNFNSLIEEQHSDSICIALWNKWIKKEIYQWAYSECEKFGDTAVSSSTEDKLIFEMCLLYSIYKKEILVQLTQDNWYNYLPKGPWDFSETSICTLNRFHSAIYNFQAACNIEKFYISPLSEKIKKWFDFDLIDSPFMYIRALNICDSTCPKIYIDELENSFSHEKIQKALEKNINYLRLEFIKEFLIRGYVINKNIVDYSPYIRSFRSYFCNTATQKDIDKVKELYSYLN